MNLCSLDLAINKVPFVLININIITQMYFSFITKMCSIHYPIENKTQINELAEVGVRGISEGGKVIVQLIAFYFLQKVIPNSL